MQNLFSKKKKKYAKSVIVFGHDKITQNSWYSKLLLVHIFFIFLFKI